MKLKNKQIFEMANNLYQSFEGEKKYFPAKINFCISKNKQLLFNEYDEINAIRAEILNKYGTLNKETNTYSFEENKIKTVNKELNDLLNIEQDLNISFISIEDIKDIEFTPQQMDAILFMIDGDEDDLDD